MGPLPFLKDHKVNCGLTYKTYIGGGDSKSYSTVAKATPYGLLVHIVKEGYVANITKRMG